jgi:hypothetical protein
MARDLQRKLEDDADKKGLHGEARERYIGGAWNRIRGVEHRSRWRYSEDSRLLERFYGPIHDFRELRGRPGEIAFRQGQTWYHLPAREYDSLVLAAADAARRERLTEKQREREDARERRQIERQLRRVRAEQREAERVRLHAEREQREAERQEAATAELQQRELREFERQQYRDVLGIIRARGGIRRSYGAMSGQEYDRGEYKIVPRSIRAKARSRRGEGLSLDDVAREVSDQIPWLEIDTPRDLLDYFERQRERRYFLMRRRSA